MVVRRRKRAKSYVTRIDGSLRALLNKVKAQAYKDYQLRLNDRDASRTLAKLIKK